MDRKQTNPGIVTCAFMGYILSSGLSNTSNMYQNDSGNQVGMYAIIYLPIYVSIFLSISTYLPTYPPIYLYVVFLGFRALNFRTLDSFLVLCRLMAPCTFLYLNGT